MFEQHWAYNEAPTHHRRVSRRAFAVYQPRTPNNFDLKVLAAQRGCLGMFVAKTLGAEEREQ